MDHVLVLPQCRITKIVVTADAKAIEAPPAIQITVSVPAIDGVAESLATLTRDLVDVTISAIPSAQLSAFESKG
jgi:hypothetical protein